MNRLLDGLWRALVQTVHPWVLALTLMPLALTGVVVGAAAAIYWSDWVATFTAAAESVRAWSQWMQVLPAPMQFGVSDLLAPLTLLLVALPVVALGALVLTSVMLVPALVRFVAKRRFAALEKRHGGSFWQSLVYSVGNGLLALVIFVGTLPLWLIPPLAFVLPPLIWGWLTYRVMSFDALAEHASAEERRTLMRVHRVPLLAMGVACGLLGAVPLLVWAVGLASVVLAPILVLVSLWLYTVVFAFSALWFAHFLLSALAERRLPENGRQLATLHPEST